MAAAEAGEVDCMRVLVKELGCNKDAQDKVTILVLCVQASVCVSGQMHSSVILMNN